MSDSILRQELLIIPTSSFVFGFVSGLLTSSRLSARQFLAENAHRLPTTVQGWYFYQKTKNYRVMYGGILGGLKTGAILGLWTGLFVGLAEGIEVGARRVLPPAVKEYKTRWASGAVAGIALAGVAGQIYRLSRYGRARRLFLGASLGTVAGAASDARDWLRVNRPVAVPSIK